VEILCKRIAKIYQKELENLPLHLNSVSSLPGIT